MRGKIVGLLGLALTCVCGAALSTPIVYTIDVGGVLTGTITTDGTIGQLDTGDITAWNLLLLAPGFPGTTFSSAIPGSEVSGEDAVLATPDLLIVNSGLSFDQPSPPGVPFPGSQGCFDNVGFGSDADGVPGIVVNIGAPPSISNPGILCAEGAGGVVARLEFPTVAGRAPEPDSFALLALALIGLGFARKRAHGSAQ